MELRHQGIELRHLRYFVGIADAGSFTHAAERMFIAQPTLSQQIRRLEEIVGTPLLERGPQGIRLTSAGTVLLEQSRTVLSLVDHGVSRTRQAAGLGRARLRIVVPPSLPDALAVATVTRLRSAAATAGIEVTWLETTLDSQFSLVRDHRADAGLGWLVSEGEALPASLELMNLGVFEPETWIPSSHPAAEQAAISRGELAGLNVVHGPRRAVTGTYDAWLSVLRAANAHFEFTDPPFRLSLPMTLAFAATARRPTAVLTGPMHPAGTGGASWPDPADRYDMVPVRLHQCPLTAAAGLVWSGDLPRPLQQVLFDAADGITF